MRTSIMFPEESEEAGFSGYTQQQQQQNQYPFRSLATTASPPSPQPNAYTNEEEDEEEDYDRVPRLVQANGHFQRVSCDARDSEEDDDNDEEEYDVEMDDYSGREEQTTMPSTQLR